MKKKMKLWEKLFVYTSIVFIIVCIIFYGYRFVYFYKIENPKIDQSDKTLFTAIKTNNNMVVINDGLYKIDDDNYYFKGLDINNYVYYSGRLWQVVSINKGSIKMITANSQTSLVWGIDNNYEKSYINTWLNGEDNVFYNSLDNQDYIVKSSFCTDKVELTKLTCQEKIENNVGLLTIKEYVQAGSENSFLNNNTYWWTINSTTDNKVWYVFPEGGISNQSNNEMTYHSYGVRPVINIKKDLTVYKGNGTIDNPFMLDSQDNIVLNTKSIGSYLTYSNYTWQIISKDENYVKVILDGYIKNNDEDYLSIYSKTNSVYDTNNTINTYLNNTFYKTLDKTFLKTCSFNIGSYGSNTSYDYKSTYKTTYKAMVGLPSVGELFINDYPNTWLANNIDSYKLTSYIVSKNNTLFADNITNTNYIRPVICLDKNITFDNGDGTKTNPFNMEVKDETNN